MRVHIIVYCLNVIFQLTLHKECVPKLVMQVDSTFSFIMHCRYNFMIKLYWKYPGIRATVAKVTDYNMG